MSSTCPQCGVNDGEACARHPDARNCFRDGPPREHWSKRYSGPIVVEKFMCPDCGPVNMDECCASSLEDCRWRTNPQDTKLRPCKSPYCECEHGKCTHPGFYDARGSAPDTNPKTRVGLTKPSMRGIPSTALLHLGGAMGDGVEKYGQFNWREHAVSASVYEDSIWRHLLAWRDREDIAADSGIHHLAHVMACCAILLDAEEMGKLNDDRGLPGNAPEIIAAWTKKAIDTPS